MTGAKRWLDVDVVANDAAYGTRRIRALVIDRANGEDES